MSQEPNARDLLFRILVQDGAKEITGKRSKHRKWKLSNNFLFFFSKTPSDFRSWENGIRDLRRVMGDKLFDQRCQELISKPKTSGRGETWQPLPEIPPQVSIDMTKEMFKPSPIAEAINEPPPIPEPIPTPMSTVEITPRGIKVEASGLVLELQQVLAQLERDRDADLAKIKRKYDEKIKAMELTLATLTMSKPKPKSNKQVEHEHPVGTPGNRIFTHSKSYKVREAIEKVIKPGEWFNASDIAAITGVNSNLIRTSVIQRMIRDGFLEARGSRSDRQYRKKESA